MGSELDGKVAVVTGGANGIGRATAEVFVEEGARVVIADLDDDAGAAVAGALGDAAAFVHTDVADADSVRAAVDHAVEVFGGLHVMVNNAGIPSSFRRLMDDDLRDFDRVMAVDLYGVIVGTQAAARRMGEGGSIVNTTSIAGISPGIGLTTYRAAKAGVIHFSRCAAIELAERGIRVNVIAPGQHLDRHQRRVRHRCDRQPDPTAPAARDPARRRRTRPSTSRASGRRRSPAPCTRSTAVPPPAPGPRRCRTSGRARTPRGSS